MDRRTAIGAGAAALTAVLMGSSTAGGLTGDVPIVDSHIHLFDPNRPQGTPATIPGSATTLTGSFPAGYRVWAEPLGVVGAIHIEASNWVEDNLWALETARANDIMVGVIGNLDPEKDEFDEFLARFARDPLFRGIRYGNIWGYDIVRGSTDKKVIDRLKALSSADLVMDTATPGIELLEAVIRLNDAIPELRIVIDHLPGFEPEAASRTAYTRLLREMSGRSALHVKLSQIIHRRNGQVSTRLADYVDTLDPIVDAFGETRVLFGSDYPNSDSVTTPAQVFRIAREYLSRRPRAAQENILFRNAWRVYKCQARTVQQHALAVS